MVYIAVDAFCIFIFMAPSSCWLYAGVLLWGIGMGAQESTLKAAVAAIIPKHERAVGYGILKRGLVYPGLLEVFF